MYLHLFKYAEFKGDVYFFRFRIEMSILGQISKFKIVCSKRNLIPRLIWIWNSMAVFILPFCTNMVQKIKNCLFKPKFGTYTNSNMKNIMVMFIFSVFDRKYPFLGILFQKIKIACFCWYLNLHFFEFAEVDADSRFFHF